MNWSIWVAIAFGVASCGGVVEEDAPGPDGEVEGSEEAATAGPGGAGGAGSGGGAAGAPDAGSGGAGGAGGAGVMGGMGGMGGTGGTGLTGGGSSPQCTACSDGVACGFPGFMGECQGSLCVVWCHGPSGCQPHPTASNTCSTSPCAGNECSP